MRVPDLGPPIPCHPDHDSNLIDTDTKTIAYGIPLCPLLSLLAHIAACPLLYHTHPSQETRHLYCFPTLGSFKKTVLLPVYASAEVSCPCAGTSQGLSWIS